MAQQRKTKSTKPNRKRKLHLVTLGSIRGWSTGEEDADVTAGGWEGTDDATSTSPSDVVAEENRRAGLAPDDEMRSFGRGWAEGGLSDLKGTPAEEERDWEHEPIIPTPG